MGRTGGQDDLKKLTREESLKLLQSEHKKDRLKGVEGPLGIRDLAYVVVGSKCKKTKNASIRRLEGLVQTITDFDVLVLVAGESRNKKSIDIAVRKIEDIVESTATQDDLMYIIKNFGVARVRNAAFKKLEKDENKLFSIARTSMYLDTAVLAINEMTGKQHINYMIAFSEDSVLRNAAMSRQRVLMIK